MRERAWLIPLALVIVIAALVLLTPNKPSRSPDHRSESDAFDGTSALYSFAAGLGHPTSAMKGSFTLPESRGLLFVFSPTVEFTDDQVTQLDNWLSGGGVLIYADPGGDTRLDALLEVSRDSLAETAQVRMVAVAPLLAGVKSVVGTDLSGPGGDIPSTLVPIPRQVPLLRAVGRDQQVLAAYERRGEGRVVVLNDPQALCNGNLGQADNGRLAADLISLAPAGSPVFFDEYHHGAGGTTPSITDWVTTPWGAVLGWALAIAYLGLLLRGRAFGPPMSLAPPRDRSSAEYASAVGTLLRRARARATTLGVLAEATRRSLAERVGAGHGLAPEQLGRLLDQRAPELAKGLAAAEAATAAGQRSEHALLEAARRLHALAYPSAENP